MKLLLGIVFSVLPVLSFSQTIEQIRLTADSVLISIVTRQAFDTAFKYNCSKSATIVNNTNWPDCGARTAKQNKLFEKQKKKEKAFDIVYDCLLLDTIEGLVKIRLDEKGNVIRFAGISPQDKYSLLSTLSINKQTAIDIALKSGFQQGLTPWSTSMTYQMLKQEEEKYYWQIKNTLKLGDNSGCNSKGEVILIDALNGDIVDKLNWINECVN